MGYIENPHRKYLYHRRTVPFIEAEGSRKTWFCNHSSKSKSSSVSMKVSSLNVPSEFPEYSLGARTRFGVSTANQQDAGVYYLVASTSLGTSLS